MKTKPKISIILPAFNSQQNLDRILCELLENQVDDTWELIVVDDGSNVPLSFGKHKNPDWKIIREEKNVGAARARNIGANEAAGEHLVFISLFLVIPEHYILDMISFISSKDFDFAQHLLFADANASLTNFQRFVTDQKGRVKISTENLDIKNCQFAAAMIKKDVFNQLGGFDEVMQHYGGHELDLIYRMDQRGLKRRIIIEDIPLKRIKNEDHNSIKRRLSEYGKIGLPRLLKKHPELGGLILGWRKTWWLLSFIGVTRLIEHRIQKQIEKDVVLKKQTYRLYLHLIVRNAWDAR
jgi:glycosyltransferase involved in cell wall biosynthesis